MAGSTQAPEESYAIDTWLALRERYPQLRLYWCRGIRSDSRKSPLSSRPEDCRLVRRSRIKAGHASRLLPGPARG